MKQIKQITLFMLVAVFTILTAGCASTQEPADAYPNDSYEEIFQKGEKAMRKKNYSEAIKRFEAINTQYPFAKYTEIAQLHLVYAYYMSDDYAMAEASADHFIHSHPINPHVDYAYYMRGLSNYFQNMGVFERFFAVDLATRDLTQIKKSYEDFRDLYQKYPNSKYAPAAHQYMVYLRNVIANHELQVANFYYKRGAYVASANRANNVVRHYQGAPAVKEALTVMAQSYRKLNQRRDEHDTLKVIAYNYPDAEILKKKT